MFSYFCFDIVEAEIEAIDIRSVDDAGSIDDKDSDANDNQQIDCHQDSNDSEEEESVHEITRDDSDFEKECSKEPSERK